MELALTQGQVTVFDDVDAPIVLAHRWWATKSSATGQFYAATKLQSPSGRWRIVQMQRLLMGEPPKMDVDHVNGDTLDNHRGNLRVATRSQNKANNRGYRTNTTGYKGVYRRGDRWCAQLRYEGEALWLGAHATPEAAARAYDAKARELFGAFASLNLPES